MKRTHVLVRTTVVFCFLILLFSSALPALSPVQQEGIAYGNVLEEGWSCIHLRGEGEDGVTTYRRKIVAIRIRIDLAEVVFANGSKRDLYSMAVINHYDTTRGKPKYWKIAAENSGDTIVLKNDRIFSDIITGYKNHHYRFLDEKPVHRDRVKLVYPNPEIPLRQRLPEDSSEKSIVQPELSEGTTILGKKMDEGWSSIRFLKAEKDGVKELQRKIVGIRITKDSANVIFSEGYARDLYSIAIINNQDTTMGDPKYWKIANENPGDTIILQNGKIFSDIITGFKDNHYHFVKEKPIHRNRIKFIYPNRNVPLNKRLQK